MFNHTAEMLKVQLETVLVPSDNALSWPKYLVCIAESGQFWAMIELVIWHLSRSEAEIAHLWLNCITELQIDMYNSAAVRFLPDPLICYIQSGLNGGRFKYRDVQRWHAAKTCVSVMFSQPDVASGNAPITVRADFITMVSPCRFIPFFSLEVHLKMPRQAPVDVHRVLCIINSWPVCECETPENDLERDSHKNSTLVDDIMSCQRLVGSKWRGRILRAANKLQRRHGIIKFKYIDRFYTILFDYLTHKNSVSRGTLVQFHITALGSIVRAIDLM